MNYKVGNISLKTLILKEAPWAWWHFHSLSEFRPYCDCKQIHLLIMLMQIENKHMVQIIHRTEGVFLKYSLGAHIVMLINVDVYTFVQPIFTECQLCASNCG